MRGMPLPFEFQGKGVVDFSSDSSQHHHHLLLQQKWKKLEDGFCGYVGVTEHTSVLDSRRSPSPPTSSSTLSSSLGSGGGGGGGGGSSTALETGSSGAAAAATAPEKCGIGGMEDWENVLSDFAVSPSRDQSMLPYLMGDIDDPTSMGLSKLLQSTAGVPPEFEFSGGFGALCQGSELGSMGGNGNFLAAINHHPSLHESTSGFSAINNGGIFSPLSNNLLPISVSQGMLQQQIHLHQQQQQQQPIDGLDEKPQIFNPQVLINQHQAQPTQNPAMFLPLSFTQQEQQHLFMPPNPKRLNTGGIMEPNNNNQIPKVPFMDSGQELYSRRQSSQLQQQQQQQQQQHHNHHQQGFPQHHHQLQLLPNHLHHQQQQRPTTMATPPPLQPGSKPKMAIGSGGGGGGEEMVLHQQATIEQIFKAVELVEMGNSVLAQGILARLNHQLSPIGKPFHRVAFYFKESLQLLLHNTTTTTTNNNNNNHNTLSPTTTTSAVASSNCSPFSLIFKIGAYKSFSEISPLVQFANFTCNQAILEALEGFDRIHIIDFDIGYGGQWASLMQELALRTGGPPSLKITAFASPSTHDELELGLTRENLNHFAGEINMPFELEIVNLESLNSTPLHVSNSEAIAVNLPIGAFSNYPLSLPLVLRFVKQLLPKIVVSLDRGCDRTDLPFPHHTIHALQSYTSLLESLDTVNVNLDALQKIERFLIHPGIERIVLGRHRFPEKTPPWKSLFLSSGFSPLTFSNFTESQADCLVQRTQVRGFHVEKRQSSLVLCWQQKDLISASAWRCC